MYPLFSCFSLLWLGLAIACPILVSFAAVYMMDQQTRRLGIAMVVAGVIGTLTFTTSWYVLLRLHGRHPFLETPLLSWCIVGAGGFAFGSLPAWIWRRHI